LQQPRKPALNYNNPQQQQQSVFAAKPAAAAPVGVEDLVEDRQPARGFPWGRSPLSGMAATG